MRIAICDDNHVVRESVKEILERNDELSISKNIEIEEASSGEELLEMHKASKFNIIFLDIEMSGISGIIAGHKIRSDDKDVIIIFITSHQQHAIESFTVEPFDYIMKPINEDIINKVLTRALQKHRDQHYLLSYRWEGVQYTIDISEIVYIDAYHGRIQFVTTDPKSEKECNGSLDEYERELLLYGFLRCHRNVLINMQHIASIGEKKIVTKCGKEVNISTRKKQHCLRIYNSYLTKYRV